MILIIKFKMKSNICRCCLADGCFKDINDTHFIAGKLEKYGEMFIKTFNLTLHSQSKICDECIEKLRDAAAFRQQIIDVECALNEQNEKLKNDHDSEPEFIIKLEPKDEGIEDESFCDAVNGSVDYIEYPENDIEVKKDMAITDELDSMNVLTSNDKGPGKDIVAKKLRVRKKKENSCNEQEDINTPKETNITSINNTLKLISNSNLCLFKTLRHRFVCYACKQTFINIKDLRTHFKTHPFDDYKFKLKQLKGVSFLNADITNLTCYCTKVCNNLDVLKSHLTDSHGIPFGHDSHLLKPYKLEDGFQCAVCRESFRTFFRLSIHMNCHATGNICEICGLAFFNRQSLRAHVKVVHGEHKCSKCSLTFTTNSALIRHTVKAHNGTPSKYYCQECNMTFPYPYRLSYHMVEKHGAKKINVECDQCGKTLKSELYLKIHIRSVHLKERQHQCSICEQRFFTKTDRVRHERTHQNDTGFACEVCDTKFKSKDSERRHMRRQHVAVGKP